VLAKPVSRILAALAILAGATVVAAPTSSAATADEGLTTLRLSVTGVGSTAARTAVLKCEPAGGSHRQAAEACGELEGVNGTFASLNVRRPGYCTTEYDPVTVTATGQWRGSTVSFEQTFVNKCVLSTRTGVVFGL
jgi:hypothetical protein